MGAARRHPLQTSDDHWASRWLVLSGWNRLHRVSDDIVWDGDDGIQQDGEDMRHGIGTTLCGRKGSLTMPGIVSRMGLPRCAHCCRLAGIPRGDGAPANSDIEESADGERAVTVTR